MSEDILYIGSVFIFLGGAVVVTALSWLAVEGAYWLCCKIRGRDY